MRHRSKRVSFWFSQIEPVRMPVVFDFYSFFINEWTYFHAISRVRRVINFLSDYVNPVNVFCLTVGHIFYKY